MGGLSGLAAAHDLFSRGRIAELVARADCRPGALTRLEPSHQLLLAHALILSGRARPAEAVALRHTGRTIDAVARSRAHTVLGLCAQLHGDIPTARFHAETGAAVADTSGDETRAAWAHLGLLRLHVDTGPATHLQRQFAHAGDLARAANAPQALAYFHECASIVDAQRGRLGDARRHCAAAEALLLQSPNLALHGTLLLNRACVLYLEGDYEQALADLHRASDYIRRSGLARNTAALRNNLAHLELFTGRFDDARRSFTSLARAHDVPRYIMPAVLDGLARTALATGALERCEATLDELDATATDPELPSVHHVRWAGLTRIRVLLARGRADAALERARALEAVATEAGDTPLLASTHLLAARAHHLLGARADAARTLRLAGGALETVPSLMAEFCHHAGCIVAAEDPASAVALRARALELWADAGASGLRAEAEHGTPVGRRHATTRADSPVAAALTVVLPFAGRAGARPHREAPRPAPATSGADVPPATDGVDALHATARRIAATDASVLISGETGTGKEVLARFIHRSSPHASGPFVPFNCAAVAKELFDAQLFGHRKGAFTGATENAPGVIRAARGGTLFLDEVGEMALDTQPKLLRFLESGEVHPVGETRPVTVPVRVIAATNADLDALMADGRFRDDLYFRLGIVRFQLPPLRARVEDIVRLAREFLQRFAADYDKGELRLDEAALEHLRRYRWPGNVRQVANEMKRVAALADPGDIVTPDALSPEITDRVASAPVTPDEHAAIPLAQPMSAAVEALERAQLVHALRACDGHAGRAAARLGLSRKGLYLKRRRHGV